MAFDPGRHIVERRLSNGDVWIEIQADGLHRDVDRGLPRVFRKPFVIKPNGHISERHAVGRVDINSGGRWREDLRSRNTPGPHIGSPYDMGPVSALTDEFMARVRENCDQHALDFVMQCHRRPIRGYNLAVHPWFGQLQETRPALAQLLLDVHISGSNGELLLANGDSHLVASCVTRLRRVYKVETPSHEALRYPRALPPAWKEWFRSNNLIADEPRFPASLTILKLLDALVDADRHSTQQVQRHEWPMVNRALLTDKTLGLVVLKDPAAAEHTLSRYPANTLEMAMISLRDFIRSRPRAGRLVMRDWSIGRLVRESEAWHRDGTSKKHTTFTESIAAKQEQGKSHFPRPVLRSAACGFSFEGAAYELRPLRTQGELDAEHEATKVCVDGYGARCYYWQSFICSVKSVSSGGQKVFRATAEFDLSGRLVQIDALRREPLPKEFRDAVRDAMQRDWTGEFTVDGNRVSNPQSSAFRGERLLASLSL